MARQTKTTRAGHAIDLPRELQLESPTSGRIERNPSLPVYRKGSNYFKNDISRPRLRHILGHLIPVVVLLLFYFFILWWFSHPVNVEMKNERIILVGKEDMPKLVNNAHLGSLTSTSSTPYPLVPYAQVLKNNSRAA